ncbi:mycofactocin system transcriptional regulator [Aeromicrobium sp.]|uniref:mycofactocin system transcriptional regulator n=1 Tax=Aeromicrobium sp. TaxID=1871063 RepID=UPI0025BCAE6C|nr:mycofactocin system transcriptional regulator [Aeromicrobium sp.]MCK5892630.1 mycofactocin system transcriptional regulator [Aeromicrobium sp.]
MSRSVRASPGRPPRTDRAEIEQAAFGLFAVHGFDGTTLDMIAGEVGVGRRTLFGYFASKNDIPWGDFAASLASFRTILADQPTDEPLWSSVHRGVVAFNDFDEAVMPLHRQRMQLILSTPTLQAHSVLQYGAWRRVIVDHVADRTGTSAGDPLPQAVGHVSLALSISAYDQWLADGSVRLTTYLEEAMTHLRNYLRI